jgi:hypothetical protein
MKVQNQINENKLSKLIVNIESFNDFVKELNVVVKGTTFNLRKVLKHPQGSRVARKILSCQK